MTGGTGGNGAGAVLEWAPFRVLPGVSEAAVLAGSDVLQRDFLEHQRGFVRRELLRGPNGDWVDLVYWADQDAADEAMQAAAASPVCAAYFHLMMASDGEAGAGVLHFRRLRAYQV